MIGRRTVELVAIGHPLFSQRARPSEIKRRRAHRHRDDPLTLPPPLCFFRDPLEDFANGCETGERNTQLLQTLALHVRVGVDDAGDDRASL
jgi:hypothetical protein